MEVGKGQQAPARNKHGGRNAKPLCVMRRARTLLRILDGERALDNAQDSVPTAHYQGKRSPKKKGHLLDTCPGHGLA
jgi:hypothetical protein